MLAPRRVIRPWSPSSQSWLPQLRHRWRGRARQGRNVVGRPRIYQAANGVWLTARVQPGYLSGFVRLGQDLDVPVRSVDADPLAITDQPGGLFHPHDGRQAVLPGDHCAVGHQAPHLRHQARDR
jgi:hypothetical protein